MLLINRTAKPDPYFTHAQIDSFIRVRFLCSLYLTSSTALYYAKYHDYHYLFIPYHQQHTDKICSNDGQ
jgi:hypothetical protein